MDIEPKAQEMQFLLESWFKFPTKLNPVVRINLYPGPAPNLYRK